MRFEAQHILLNDTPLGDIQIRYYGIIIVVAMLVAAWVAARMARQRGYDPDHIWGGLTWAIFPGIIGARLWFVLFPPVTSVAAGRDTAWLLANFFNPDGGAIAIWTGGLGIFGAVIGGLIGVWLYCSRWHNSVAFIFWVIFYPVTLVSAAVSFAIAWVAFRLLRRDPPSWSLPRFTTTFPASGLPLLPWLDIAGVVLPLAQFIGRWANYVNQELYGTPTDLPWGITIDSQYRVAPYTSPVDYPASTRFHPLFLYEGLWNLAAFFVLSYLYNRYRNRFKPGDFFLLYVMQYSVVRFLLEFLRVEIATIGTTGINSSQATTAVAFALALVIFLVRRASRSDVTYDEATAMPQNTQAAAA